MKNILQERLRAGTLIFDGAMGTEIYKRKYFFNTSYENLCLTAPKVIQEIHQSYKDAGAEVLLTNTYGANFNKLNKFGLGDKVAEINRAAAAIAKKVAGTDVLVAGSIGPIGDLPDGMEFDDAKLCAVFQEQAAILADAGVDFLLFESIPSLAEVRVILKAMEVLESETPYAVSMTLRKDGSTETGDTPEQIMEALSKAKLKPTAFGINCVLGPESMLEAVERVIRVCPFPMIVRPHAGQPKSVDDRMIYLCSPEYFTTYAARYVALGVQAVGGCCGITPDDIRDMARSLNPFSKIRKHVEVIENQKTDVPLQDPVPLAERSPFAAKLQRKQWVTNVEIVPPQGYSLEQTIAKAKICKEAGFDAINIPDGPRASSRISTLVTAYKIQAEAGIEAILHMCCRDKNLIGMQAELLGCAALNINNILFITGDPPKLGDYPFASGVFDMDSIGMLRIQSRLNRGVDIGGKSIGTVTRAFPGGGADPNAIDMDREIRRTREKIDAGAEFIITQPVFDVVPLLKFMEQIPEFEKIPLIAGIWPLASFRNAEFMKNEVPGVVVPDEIMVRMGAAQTKEEQRAEGIRIARESIEKIRGRVAGVQVSAPFGNVNTAIEVIR